jgi:predicted SAM-dependent methyltransferase
MILELGCGKTPKSEGVINVDIRPLPNVDVVADLMNLPFDDNSVDEIRSRDVIEHFSRNEIIPLLKEWARVLKPEGVMYNRTVDLGRTMDKWRSLKYGDVMNAVLGAQDYDQNFHKMMFTKESVPPLFEQAGLKCEIKRYSQRGNPRMLIISSKI